jgi:hypothetical protein
MREKDDNILIINIYYKSLLGSNAFKGNHSFDFVPLLGTYREYSSFFLFRSVLEFHSLFRGT